MLKEMYAKFTEDDLTGKMFGGSARAIEQKDWQERAILDMTMGRLIISDRRDDVYGELIMGNSGLFIYFCYEDKARRLLTEYEDMHKEKRCVAPHETVARCVFEMSSTYFGGETGETHLLDLWINFKGKQMPGQAVKPGFPSPADAVKAGLIGIPFWKNRGLWTTSVANDIIQEQRFVNALGYELLASAHEMEVVNKAADLLMRTDMGF